MEIVWEMHINGKRALNGALYGVHFTGTARYEEDPPSIYDVVKEVVAAVKSDNSEMEITEACQITICQK